MNAPYIISNLSKLWKCACLFIPQYKKSNVRMESWTECVGCMCMKGKKCWKKRNCWKRIVVLNRTKRGCFLHWKMYGVKIKHCTHGTDEKHGFLKGKVLHFFIRLLVLKRTFWSHVSLLVLKTLWMVFMLLVPKAFKTLLVPFASPVPLAFSVPLGLKMLLAFSVL